MATVETLQGTGTERSETDRGKIQGHTEQLGVYKYRIDLIETSVSEVRAKQVENDAKVAALQLVQTEHGAALTHAVEALGEIKDRLADLVESMHLASEHQSREMRRSTHTMLKIVASWMGKRVPDDVDDDSDPPAPPPRPPARSGMRPPSRTGGG